jgi:amidase
MNDGFVPGTTRQDVPTVRLPLSGLRLSVKDVIDVAGLPTGAGHPLWRATHDRPTADADVVTSLLSAGASFVGKTQTDELAYSLFGTNLHFGTPVNPAAPDRVPGGSSSGAASTVAAGLADVGLGTDTAGSIRVPAGWCGLFGLRPSHARVSRRGVVPLAPRFDVPGLMTRDLATMRAAASALLGGDPGTDVPSRLWLPAGLWPSELQAVLRRPLAILEATLRLEEGEFPLVPSAAFGISQGAQAWQVHGDWISKFSPTFGPGVEARFRAAAAITPERAGAAEAELDEFRERLGAALTPDVILVLPTAPSPAPRLGLPVEAQLRARLLPLTTIASICGLPALSLPVAHVNGMPLGLCLVGAAGTDEAVLTVAGQLFGTTARL